MDTGFDPRANGGVNSLVVQGDGKILVAGYFRTLSGQSRNNIGRLNNTDPATQSLTYNASTITWRRGGSNPEIWRTTFEHAANGSDWTNLGAGSRIAGGWQLTGLSLPPSGSIRARGHVVGAGNDSGWFVETMMATGAPVIFSQPASRTDHSSATATFSVLAGGTPPLSYQWRKNGLILGDGGSVSGATAATLTLAGVLRSDAGNYWVVISNGPGSVTSVVATLTVADPAITTQPASASRNPGESVTFSVVAIGTAPLSYQWWKEGAALAGATEPSLTLTKLPWSDAGNYVVVVANAYGAASSAVAVLTVNQTSLDPSFDPAANGPVFSLAVQADGKILVGGGFTTLGGQSREHIGRLQTDGTLDSSFNPGAEWYVTSLALQGEGKILVGGSFTTLGGQSRSRIGRLHADGTLDSSFNPGGNGWVSSLAVQADGKILVGGDFNALGGQSRTNLGRLNADGTLDTGFDPGADGAVFCLAVQADGKILVGGVFTLLGGQSRKNMGRLNADGTLDARFDPGANSWVNSLVVQADGRF